MNFEFKAALVGLAILGHVVYTLIGIKTHLRDHNLYMHRILNVMEKEALSRGAIATDKDAYTDLSHTYVRETVAGTGTGDLKDGVEKTTLEKKADEDTIL